MADEHDALEAVLGGVVVGAQRSQNLGDAVPFDGQVDKVAAWPARLAGAQAIQRQHRIALGSHTAGIGVIDAVDGGRIPILMVVGGAGHKHAGMAVAARSGRLR